MNILIVDDDVYLTLYLEEILKNCKDFKEPLKIKVLNNGVYLIKESVKFNPDIILMDLMLKECSGVDYIKLLTRVELTYDIPIIAISAKSDFEDVKEAIDAGSFDYVKKPINKLELITKIKIANNYRQNNKLMKKYQIFANVNESLLQAQRIQTSLFPDKIKRKLVLPKSEMIYLPKDILTGDFLWLNKINDIQKLVFVGDCTGHGLPGSLLTVMSYTLLEQNLNYIHKYKPSDILNYLSEQFSYLLKSNDTYSFNNGIDGICLLFDDKYIEYSSSRTNLIIISKFKSIFVDDIENFPCDSLNEYNLYIFSGNIHNIGKDSYNKLFDNYRIKLNEGDKIYLFTDGYADQFGGKEIKSSKFSKKRFYELLLNIQNESLESQRNIIYDNYIDWKGDLEQLDDILGLIIEI